MIIFSLKQINFVPKCVACQGWNLNRKSQVSQDKTKIMGLINDTIAGKCIAEESDRKQLSLSRNTPSSQKGTIPGIEEIVQTNRS